MLGSTHATPHRHALLALLTGASLRAFCIGLTGILLGLHLGRQGIGPEAIGVVVGAGLAGNAAATAWLTWGPAGSPRMRLITTSLVTAVGLLAIAVLTTPAALAIAACLGLVNGMGRDRGPAQVLEQSILSDALPESARARGMTWYTAVQDVGGSLGSLAAALPDVLPGEPIAITRVLLVAAALTGLVPALLYACLLPPAHPSVSAARPRPVIPAGTRTRVRRLATLFALDSLGGGFLAASILSYWFFARFGVTGTVVGPLFVGARALNAVSYFVAERLARHLGLIRTMVFTHLPSSALLLLLPWAPSVSVAVLLFLAREALVQMDVPARQAFVAKVTQPGEREYAFGVTSLVRNLGWATGPALAGLGAQFLGLAAPLLLGAGLKIVYDLALYRAFVREGVEG